MKRYRHVFFDLDHTLWDMRTNSRDTLRELHGEMDLAARGVEDVNGFIEAYEEINEGLWRRYENGTIDKSVLRVLRFRNTLLRFGVRNDTLASELGQAYLGRCPRRSSLNPGVSQFLDSVGQRYAMHVITNGFAEVQHLKLASSGITDRFQVVLTSEEAGARKPDPHIFLEAMRRARCRPDEALMVGDNALADMAGARGVRMDHAHYTGAGDEPDPQATYRIAHFDELRVMLL